MKTFLKVIVGIVAAIVLLVAAVFYFTSGLVDTADAFFQAVKRQDIAAARTYLAEDFKANTDETALRAFLAKTALLNFKQASWSSREITNGRGELRGSVTTESGGNIPVTLTFVKENGGWKIYSLRKPSAGITSDTENPVPNEPERIALAKRTMDDFTASVRAGNMQQFRASTSQLWQQQFPLEKFEDAFRSAYSVREVFDEIADRQPLLKAGDGLGEHGELKVSGSFTGRSHNVEFDAKYIYEGSDWKLIGFHFKV